MTASPALDTAVTNVSAIRWTLTFDVPMDSDVMIPNNFELTGGSGAIIAVTSLNTAQTIWEITTVNTTMGNNYQLVPDYESLTGCNATELAGTIGTIGFYVDTEELDASAFKVQVAPNPAHDILNIEFLNSNHKNVTLELFDLQGRKLQQQQVNTNQVQLDLQDYPTGIYLLQVQTEEEIKTIKVVKQ